MERPVIVNPSGAARLAERYAHAVVAGGAVYLGGQIGEGATLVEQFDSAAAKVVTALRAAGGEPEHLVSLVVYTTEMDEYRASAASSRRSGNATSAVATRRWRSWASASSSSPRPRSS